MSSEGAAMRTMEGLEEMRERLRRDPQVRERIAIRAYELYQLRGGEPGRDADDWFLAENEILNSLIQEQNHHEEQSGRPAATPVDVHSVAGAAAHIGPAVEGPGVGPGTIESTPLPPHESTSSDRQASEAAALESVAIARSDIAPGAGEPATKKSDASTKSSAKGKRRADTQVGPEAGQNAGTNASARKIASKRSARGESAKRNRQTPPESKRDKAEAQSGRTDGLHGM